MQCSAAENIISYLILDIVMGADHRSCILLRAPPPPPPFVVHSAPGAAAVFYLIAVQCSAVRRIASHHITSHRIACPVTEAADSTHLHSARLLLVLMFDGQEGDLVLELFIFRESHLRNLMSCHVKFILILKNLQICKILKR